MSPAKSLSVASLTVKCWKVEEEDCLLAPCATPGVPVGSVRLVWSVVLLGFRGCVSQVFDEPFVPNTRSSSVQGYGE